MSHVPGADGKKQGKEAAGAHVQFSRHPLGNCVGWWFSGHTVSVPQRRSFMLLLLCPFIGQVGKRPQRLGTLTIWIPGNLLFIGKWKNPPHFVARCTILP